MKKLATALGVALVIAGIAAGYLWQDLRTQRRRNAEAMARVAAPESPQPMASVAAPATVDGTRAGLPGLAPASAAAAAAAPAAPGKAANGSSDSMVALMEKMRSTPEGQEFQRIMMRQMLEEQYPDLAKDLNLSPEKAAKLLDLLAKRDMDEFSEILSPRRGGPPDRAALAEMARKSAENERKFEAEMKALLGDSYGKWDEYEEAALQRESAENTRMAKERLRTAISSGTSPLTDAQFEYFNSAITAEQQRINKESGGLSLQQFRQRIPENNRRLAEVAAAHLNPQQLDRYKRHLQQQQEMMNSMDAMGMLFDDDEP